MTYTFTLNEKDAQLVINALMELPYKMSMEVINTLMQQVNEQRTAADAGPAKAE